MKKERPILFSASMVRAILDGRKTQTRRIVKDTGLYAIDEKFHGEETANRERGNLATQCKYGQPGDWLWVKETFQAHPIYGYPVYRSDYMLENGRYGPNPVDAENWPWRPSIFMPRRASRITLKITSVRVERLQDISDTDALAEGITGYEHGADQPLPVMCYQTLWDSLNAKRGFGWNVNPWVWVLEFRRTIP